MPKFEKPKSSLYINEQNEMIILISNTKRLFYREWFEQEYFL
jgi:hypothetical protein